MGLLDDAIREHLELKRRRGADTAEVARQEQEAFGPPRRGEFEAPAHSEAVAVEERPHEHVFDLDDHRDQAPRLDEAAEAPTGLHAVEDPHPLQTEPPRPHGDPADALPHAHAEPAPEPVARHEPEPRHESQPTEAFDAEEVRAATRAPAPEPVAPEPAREPDPAPDPAPEPAPRAAEAHGEDEGEDGDVLEETPEFLQETPEHDRLWFEQRPPRDFDF